MDRVSVWDHNVDATCGLCNASPESRNHLFFGCSYSSQLWEYLSYGLLRSSYSNDWSSIMPLLCQDDKGRKWSFCIRYAFQACLYAIWRERNKIKHGERATPVTILKKLVAKSIRNKLSLIENYRRKGMEGVLIFWFEARS
ncbi:uncharacterized protein LOC130502626 [Raphanus sativus]|uniref:Uncharacterized protein LOC130502626 n=1 Tax=Raphanus sativus TaxID=3726 RepID=A0A9W3CP16_RAPSA|nr:uncharacterized protein LOC130502626 [Raphanus sativus]